MVFTTHLLAGAKLIDVSVTLREGVACWPGEDFWRLEAVARMSDGDACNVSKFSMGAHMGTHVDAPWHFGYGEETVEKLDLSRMVTPARVIELSETADRITRSALEGRLEGTPAVLLKTRNSGKLERGEPFDRGFVHLTEEAADYLVQRGVRTVGVDYLSVDGYGVAGAPVHHRLLAAGVFIVEGLDLSAAPPGDYLFIILPLKIAGADGAPARAILIDLAEQGR